MQDRLRPSPNPSPILLRGKGWNVAGSILKRSATNYVVKVYQGSGKYKWYGGFRTRREAEQFQVSLASHPSHAANVGLYGSSRARFGVYLRDWLKAKDSRLRPKTRRTYRDLLEKHVIPDLGGLPLAKIGPRTLDEQYSRLLKRGLSPTTVHHVAVLLHKTFADAVRQEIVAQNPCDMTDPPTRATFEGCVLDVEQIRVFLGEAKRNSRHYVLYLAAITTGMRQSELLGLRWQDVNLTLGVLTIRQQFYRIAGKQFYGPPKSRASGRSISLPSILVEELRRLPRNGELVFSQPNGKPHHANNIIRRDLPRVLKRARLPKVRFHDLRHSCATAHFAIGTHPRVVQELLGHSSIGVTMDTYSHVLPGMQAQAVADLEGRLFPAPDLHLDSRRDAT